MHWPLAISRNLDALRAVVAAIGALLAGHNERIARRLRNAAFAMLRPAEAAARRLIVIAARGLRPGGVGHAQLRLGRKGSRGGR